MRHHEHNGHPGSGPDVHSAGPYGTPETDSASDGVDSTNDRLG